MSYTKKAAAFGKLVGICAGYEGKYNPARQNLTLSSIRNLEVDAQVANAAVDAAFQEWSRRSSSRRLAFSQMRDWVAKVREEIKASVTDVGSKKLLLSAASKFMAYSKAGNADPPAAENEKPVAVRAASGRDYASRMAAFESLLHGLAATPEYLPSTPELSVEALQAHAAAVKALTVGINAAYAELQEARSRRRMVFDAPFTGVKATAKGVRSAVRSIFGSRSDELRTIAAVRI